MTPRQTQTLRLASLGLTEQETARELGVSVWTVKDHRRRVLQILGATTTAQAVAFAYRDGLLR